MAEGFCAISGAAVKPRLARPLRYHSPVSLNYRKILAGNIAALQNVRPDLKSHAKLAKQCSTATRKIGARTIGHVLNAKDGPQPQLDTIVAIADAFRVPAWLLLTPDFDPKGKTGGALPPADALELAYLLTEMPAERRELLLGLFRKEGATNQTTPAAHWRPETTLHQVSPPYDHRPRKQK